MADGNDAVKAVAARTATKEEREACARLVESHKRNLPGNDTDEVLEIVAAKIRARSGS